MSFEIKKNKAIELMESAGLWKSNSVPYLVVLLWKMGVKIPPPTFANFWLNTVIYGAFGGILATFILYLEMSEYRVSSGDFFIQGFVIGITFGVTFALFHLYRRKSKKLPDWKDL
ncbi:hypothetical protein ID852_12320 [Xenorhabdus sp. 42]|uniref:Uncharacterized protein n=1 Tax=Xenorhabdus szentirmaii TaxID=290112 RepID=A0AAW3YLQ0_9GAMM|nr:MULTISPECIES: DUF6404 family protein [Xenorhabdus]MBD2793687.1 hypothetical protein [Xenorhabdus sp. CUL]MBD2798965.1 hypothetical protein [Xenorhabdus sp. M]MBD2805584.1 hypothetical protein [Xenorhabdus sp. ZM]MBD2821464.1 hypothetical protein [Xenorhabdus sp. 42]MBD2826509.1 hypothetical protein [Xenorhabdus sp. 5]